MTNKLKAVQTGSLLIAIGSLPLSMPVCHSALALYLIAWCCEGRLKEKADILINSPIIWGYVAFFALQVIGVGWSNNAGSGWFNVEQKVSLLLLPAAFATSFSLDKNSIQLLLKGFILTCVVSTLYCLGVATWHAMFASVQANFDDTTLSLYEQLNPHAGRPWMFFSYIELASGIGIHPTYLSLYLVFSILLLIHLHAVQFERYSTVKKVSIILLFLYLETVTVLLSSRTMIITLAILSTTGAWFASRSITARRPLRYGMLAVTLTPLLLVLLINPVVRYRNLQEPTAAQTYTPSSTGVYSFSTGIRKSLWIAGIRTALTVNPVFGVGPGDVKDAMKFQIADPNIIESYDPHNQFLYTQIGLGLVGLFVLLFCLYAPAWLAWRQKNLFYLGFILLITFLCLTESVFETQKGVVFFAIFNSILVFPYLGLGTPSPRQLVYG